MTAMSDETSAKNMATLMKPLAEFLSTVTTVLSMFIWLSDRSPELLGAATALGSLVSSFLSSSSSPAMNLSASLSSFSRSRCSSSR
jgi:hypothetical protein